MATPTGYWNHNVHYHPMLLDAMPAGCREALDVGCGDGLLVRRLAARAQRVTGVDRSPEMIRLARATSENVGNAGFVETDILDLDEGHYDFVTAVAVIHHLDFRDAVTAMARLLAPGGRLVIVGLANNRTPLDWVVSGAGLPASRLLALRRGGKSDPAAPIREPDMTWGEIRRAARRLLPGCRFRRHLLWRYSVTWDKPQASPDRCL